MPVFPDLELFDHDLHLPIGGKTYTVPGPRTFEDAKHIREVIADTGLPTVEQINEVVNLLGEDLINEMMGDGVPWTMVVHAGRTGLLFYGFSPDMAKLHWSIGQLASMTDIDDLTASMVMTRKERRHFDRAVKKASSEKEGDS